VYLIKYLCLLSVFISLKSSAGFLLEPYLCYKAYGSTEQVIAGQTTKWSSSGPALGARLGFSSLGFMAGIDYSVGQFQLKRQTTVLLTTSSTKDDYHSNAFGFFLGYDFPLLLRVWGTYFLSTNYEDQDGANKGERFSGSGYGAGIGLKLLPFFSLNLEARRFELDSFRVTNDKRSLPSQEIPKPLEILLSISLPLHL
jgi:hypothetical protein